MTATVFTSSGPRVGPTPREPITSSGISAFEDHWLQPPLSEQPLIDLIRPEPVSEVFVGAVIEEDLAERPVSFDDLIAWGRAMEGGDASHMLDI